MFVLMQFLIWYFKSRSCVDDKFYQSFRRKQGCRFSAGEYLRGIVLDLCNLVITVSRTVAGKFRNDENF